jgi:opacity protein-like surface antigen
LAGKLLAILADNLREVRCEDGLMKRVAMILAVTAAGAMAASAPARAGEQTLADRIMNAVYEDLGLSAKAAERKRGFFVGVHSGLGAESGLAPEAAGISIPLDVNQPVTESVTANAYYVYTFDWSLGIYSAAGVGKLNLADEPLVNSSLPRGDFAYQGMAGITYSFTPSMALGLEYRYSETVDDYFLTQRTLPNAQEESQSVTLRFDFLLN